MEPCMHNNRHNQLLADKGAAGSDYISASATRRNYASEDSACMILY